MIAAVTTHHQLHCTQGHGKHLPGCFDDGPWEWSEGQKVYVIGVCSNFSRVPVYLLEPTDLHHMYSHVLFSSPMF